MGRSGGVHATPSGRPPDTCSARAWPSRRPHGSGGGDTLGAHWTATVRSSSSVTRTDGPGRTRVRVVGPGWSDLGCRAWVRRRTCRLREHPDHDLDLQVGALAQKHALAAVDEGEALVEGDGPRIRRRDSEARRQIIGPSRPFDDGGHDRGGEPGSRHLRARPTWSQVTAAVSRRPPARCHAHEPAIALRDDHDPVVAVELKLPGGIRFVLRLGQRGTERIGRVSERAKALGAPATHPASDGRTM